MTKDRAIVIFVPAKPEFIAQYNILHYCWKQQKIHLDTDLIVFCPKSIKNKIHDDCIVINFEEQTELRYRTANSIMIFETPEAQIIKNYKYVLKSDCDVFLTPAFRKWRPYRKGKFFTGKGGYSNDNIVKNKLKQISKEMNLNHHGLFNVGSTWYGTGEDILNVSILTGKVLRYITNNYFQDNEGKWPSWYRGVSLMYSGEIAVNHLMSEKLMPHKDRLDFPSTSNDTIDNHPHIHCWHTDKLYSKFAYAKGKYNSVDVKLLKTNIIHDYCLDIALKANPI